MNYQKLLFGILLFSVLVSNAAAVNLLNPESSGKPQIDDPDPSRFSVCYGNTCHTVEHVSLSPQQWEAVREFFLPLAETPEQERSQIANAIAYLEVEVGKQINSLGDRGGNLKGFGSSSNQLDCVDESTNSTSYMRMMEKDGLFQFHRVDKKRQHGFLIIGGWPHSTAAIQETGSGKRWAVDSWFHDNGTKPDIVTMKKWKAGWRPENN
ncbi:hypothetical protein [Solemya velum gill symbiont]|uniref:hypothetical protein n=1 Tax=Solemya velum gill symbiont TaxID=2340 RepID=UPI000996495B|nr:hypothetical protein [Solemya velum gill symbiont]